MKKITLLFLLLAASAGMFAQSGNTCDSAKVFPAGNSCVKDSTVLSAVWHKFVADSSRVKIIVHNSPDTTKGHVHRIIVYSGTCVNPVYFASQSIANVNDTIIVLDTIGFNPGETYLVKAETSTAAPGCRRCTLGPAVFKVCVENLSSTCILSIHCPSTPVCTGVSADFSSCVTNACFGGYSWTFTGPVTLGPFFTSACVFSQTFSVCGNYTATVCEAVNPVNCLSCSFTVYKSAPPSIAITPSTINPCLASNICFNVQVGNICIITPLNLTTTIDFGDGSPLVISTNNLNPVFCHQYISPGSFTVTVTTSTPCGTNTATVTVNVSNPQPNFSSVISNCNTATFTDLSTCPSGIASWSWNFGDNTTLTYSGTQQNPIIHTYTNPGQYTVTLTITDINGNNYNFSSVITISSPPNATITGSTTTCQQPATYCVTLPSGGNVVWTVPSGISWTPAGPGCITVTNWGAFVNSGTTISATITDASGCSGTGSINVALCCQNPPAVNYINDNTQNILGANPLAFTNTTFYINGILTVNSPLVTFSECKVFLGPGAQIIINNGSTLKIQSLGAPPNCYSHLKAGCGQMWSGIVINPSASFQVYTIATQAVLIEDAEVAVTSLGGGVYDLRGAWFNKNYKGVLANPFAGTHFGNISRSVFTCHNFSASDLAGCPPNFVNTPSTSNFLFGLPSASLLPPHAGQRSFAGFESVFVNSIRVGNSGFTYDNLFDNLDYGIITGVSNISIINNQFQNLSGVSPQPPNLRCPIGTAVCGNSIASIFTSFTKNLTVGGPTDDFGNVVTHCFEGVNAQTNLNVDVERNKFFTIDEAAIIVADCEQRSIDLKVNKINEAFFGIFCYNNPQSNMNILRNKVDLLPLTPNNNARGIWVIDLAPVSGGSTDITQNIVTGMRFGIKVDNKDAPQVRFNNVFVRNIGSSSIFASGIFTSNCTGANFVYGNTAESNIPNSAQNFWESGIRIDMSPTSVIQCNITQNIGDGIFSGGQMPNTQYQNNEMRQDHFRGFVQNFGFIGPQGASGSPNDNQWTGTFSFHTFTYFSNGATFPFWVRSVTGPYNPSPYLAAGFPLSPIPLSPTTGTSGVICVAPRIGNGTAFSRSVVANTSTSPDVLLGKFAIFKTMRVDTAMNSDGVLAQFRDSMRNNEWGELDSVSRALIVPLGANAFAGLSAFNNSVAPTDSITLLHRQANKDALMFSAFRSNVFTSAQLHQLRKIARLCPYKHGVAVYQARAILKGIEPLNVEYWNDCEKPHDPQDNDANERNAGSPVNNSFSGKLYPNPSSGQMTLEYELPKGQNGELVLFDYMGRQAAKYILSDKQNMLYINETNLPSGIYLCKIYVNGHQAASEKIIISK